MKLSKFKTAKIFILASALLFSSFLFSVKLVRAAGPTKLAGKTVTEPTTWTKEGSPYLLFGWNVIAAPLTIEKGVLVKFGQGSLERLIIQDDFIVKGTSDEPVIFTSLKDDEHGGDTNGDGNSHMPSIGDWLYISVSPSHEVEIEIKHAQFFYGSSTLQINLSSQQNRAILIKKCEFRKNGTAISYSGKAEALLDSNVISENSKGVVMNSSRASFAVNNAIFGNGQGISAVNSSDPSTLALNARYNWWGDKSGPYNANDNPSGTGNSVSGQVEFSPWLKENPLKNPDPVIIVPGIMGSWEKDGIWQIDPIFHTFDDLRSAFLASGYEYGKSYFEFPYEWRDSNAENAKLLHARIQKIKEEAGRPKVGHCDSLNGRPLGKRVY